MDGLPEPGDLNALGYSLQSASNLPVVSGLEVDQWKVRRLVASRSNTRILRCHRNMDYLLNKISEDLHAKVL